MKSKKILIRYILIILIILNCITIFNFSSEKSEKSQKTSGRVVNAIIEINPKTKNLNSKEKEKAKENIAKPVRKTAHFTIYTILGILIFLCANTFKITNKKRILISIMLSFLYACTDEIHQLYVPGRAGQFKDVCIDTCGAIFGICIVYIILKYSNNFSTNL